MVENRPLDPAVVFSAPAVSWSIFFKLCDRTMLYSSALFPVSYHFIVLLVRSKRMYCYNGIIECRGRFEDNLLMIYGSKIIKHVNLKCNQNIN